MSEAAQTSNLITVESYQLPADRYYHPDHVWVLKETEDTVRIGFDVLGQETIGTIVHLELPAVGTSVQAGGPLGSIEAAKYVGSVSSPVSGVVTEVNEEALRNPSLVNSDPFGQGWLLALRSGKLDDELAGLITGAEDLRSWFAAKVKEYRLKGVLAE
ncbi:MAG: glycine cleavage system protein H [Dehalococcoidia bacterium]